MTRIRNLLVDSPNSLGAYTRRRRWDLFQHYFPQIEDMTVVDLGGRAETWVRAPVHPRHVLVLNLGDFSHDAPDWISQRYADACDLPGEVMKSRYDLVFSNSLIEHVGGHARRELMAEAVHGLADRHWVQTPYRYFPVEPHWIFPFFQFLPVSVRATIAQRWRLVHTLPSDRSQALRKVMSVELLSRTEMQAHFPESQIVDERIGPLTKSLIAVRPLEALA